MHTEKYSFIKRILGPKTYEEIKTYAQKCIPIATIVLVFVLTLTCFVHWGFLSSVLSLITGTSIVFVAYILGVVLLLDNGVDVEMEETYNGDYKLPDVMPAGYFQTKVWGIVLIILAAVAIYCSYKYRNHYAFECETFVVEVDNGKYHLEDARCGEVKGRSTRMKGYEIEELGYTLCESCEIWAEEAEEFYESVRYYRR